MPERRAAKKPPAPAAPPRGSVHPPDRATWRAWLKENHTVSTGIWLIYDKKTARADRLAYAEAVEEALCFGWIDGVYAPIDDARYKQLFTPRKAKSTWSAINKQRVERLAADGLMAPAGYAAIESGKADGSWTAIDHVEAHAMPDDLLKALAKNPKARKHFEAFSPSVRKGALYWIEGAKRPETRAIRVKEVVRMAAENTHRGVLLRARIEANRVKKK